jgi:hypothetical protein
MEGLTGPLGHVVASGDPELFNCAGTRRKGLVETRRLELLTLSLQRRRSAN